MRAPAIAILLLVAVAPCLVSQQSVDSFSVRITQQLARTNPKAAAVFQLANQASDSGDLSRAETLYRQVRQMAPDFQDATRRLCGVVMRLGRRREALTLCHQAFTAQPTPYNRAALTWVLVQKTPTDSPTAADIKEAVGYSKALVADSQWTEFGLVTACQAAIAGRDMELLQSCSARLERVGSPDASHYAIWLLDMAREDYAAARVHLEQGRAAGMSSKLYAQLMQVTQQSRPFLLKLVRPAGLTVAVWLGSLILLLVLGLVLSAATLRAVQRPVVQPGATPAITVRLRRVYRTVLWLCCAYYYISLPLVVLLVIALGGGMIYGLFAMGVIPIKLILIILLVVMLTGAATINSIFVRVEDEDPGQRLNLDNSPDLRSVLGDVARAINTRPVDTVYLTPGTDLAVMERGGMLRQLRGHTERCLILGIGVLDGMKLGAFKALLAHEYGHFSNRDTAGGGFALAVRRSLFRMAHELAEEDVATWYNPAWLFLQAFSRVFLRISQGASRLQEVLADTWAAMVYGAELFEQGLRHVVERSIRFGAHVDATVQDVIDRQQLLINLYTHRPAVTAAEGDIQAAVDAAMKAQPTPYDSHPAPSQRLEWVRAIAAQPAHRSGVDDDADAWVLFRDRATLEQSMTVLVNAAIDKRFGKSRRARVATPS